MPSAQKQPPGAIEQAVMSALRDAMTTRRLQQTAVAALIGVSTSQLSRIMSGKRPASFTEIVRLSEVLGIDLAAVVKAAENVEHTASADVDLLILDADLDRESTDETHPQG